MALAITVGGSFAGTFDKVGDLNQRIEATILQQWATLFTLGTGANQANEVVIDTRAVAANTIIDLDFTAVQSLLRLQGETTIAFTTVRALAFAVKPTSAAGIVIGANSSTFVGPLAFTTAAIRLRPGDAAVFLSPDATGWPVVASTGNILKIQNPNATLASAIDFAILGSV